MIDVVANALSRYRIPTGTEAEMHRTVALALTECGLIYAREVTLGSAANRIDFVVESATGNNVGIECKIDGSPSAVTDQLLRYAESGKLAGLVLLTSKASHLAFLQSLDKIAGIPLVKISANRGAF